MVKKRMTSLDLSCRNVIVSVLKKILAHNQLPLYLKIVHFLFFLQETIIDFNQKMSHQFTFYDFTVNAKNGF